MKAYKPRKVCSCTDLLENELFDTVGLVLYVQEPKSSIDSRGHLFSLQNIYILDFTQSVLMITVRDSIPNFPLKSGSENLIVAITNLIYRRFDSLFNIHKCSRTDSTEYLLNPKQEYLRNAHLQMQQLKLRFDFWCSCNLYPVQQT